MGTHWRPLPDEWITEETTRAFTDGLATTLFTQSVFTTRVLLARVEHTIAVRVTFVVLSTFKYGHKNFFVVVAFSQISFLKSDIQGPILHSLRPKSHLKNPIKLSAKLLALGAGERV